MKNNQIISSAISAGFGAMLFRNKLHRLQEGLSETTKSRLKTGAKVGAGLAAAGAVGAGLYNKFKGNDDDDGGASGSTTPAAENAAQGKLGATELKSSHTPPTVSEEPKKLKSPPTTNEEPIPHKTGVKKSNYFKTTLRKKVLGDEVSNKGILPVWLRGKRKPEGHGHFGKG